MSRSTAKDNPKILIVDDETETLKFVALALNSHRYHLLGAPNGRKALEILEREPDIALILLDVVMPGLSGFDVLNAIRANPQTNNIRVIMLSGLANTDDKIRAFESGAHDFIPKPFEITVLLARIKMHLKSREMELALQEAEANARHLVVERTQALEETNHRLTEEIKIRQMVQEELQKERGTLTRRVAERTAELSAANAELARVARMKDEFLASMSHELRTPLNAILGMAEALSEQIYGDINQDQQGALKNISDSGRHLLDLINDILDLSKIGAGKMVLELGPINVQSLCDASLGLIKRLAQQKQIRLKFKLDPNVKLLYADQRRLKQILINLLSNAVKFTPNGGTVGLTVKGDPHAQTISFAVWDTGIGIPNNQLPLLFKSFVQLDRKLSRRFEGTGLGLALVQKMTELHGGAVNVESVVDRGSRFTITLPWETGTETPPTEKDAAITSLKQIVADITQVLVIEDAAVVNEQYNRYLRELGIFPVICTTGAAGLQKAAELKPQLIFLDILLPDTNGWAILKTLKNDKTLQDVPVIIVSVLDEKQKGVAAGAAHSLVKPLTREKLHQVLTRLKLSQTTVNRSNSTERPSILLAEDNELNIKLTFDFLTSRGFQVSVSRNGEETVQRAQELHPDLILMDIQMPIMDGLEATRRLRQNAALTQTPIIALTALTMPGDKERCFAAGVNDYLSKPVTLNNLLQTINRHLNGEE